MKDFSILLLLFLSIPCSAVVFNVDSNEGTSDVNQSDNLCVDVNGQCSRRRRAN